MGDFARSVPRPLPPDWNYRLALSGHRSFTKEVREMKISSTTALPAFSIHKGA